MIERLKALERADRDMTDRVHMALEQVLDQQSDNFVSIHQQIESITTQLVENAKKRMKTSADDPLYSMLEEEQRDLTERQQALEAKKEKLGIVDSSEEIEQLHSLLGNFEAVWPTFDLEQRQRAFSLLIHRIEVETISPHWIRLSIDWLDAISPRLDIAYIWKATPSRNGAFRDEEHALLRQHYPRSTRMEILQLLPNRTWCAIQQAATPLGLKRDIYSIDDLCPALCYADLCPTLDGTFLFRDLATTVAYCKEAVRNTSKTHTPLYAFWLLSENVDTLLDLIQRHLSGEKQASPISL